MLKTAPALWNIQTKGYRDRNLKFDETTKIAVHFETNMDEIPRKIKSLKTQFSQEWKKIVKKTRTNWCGLWKYNYWFERATQLTIFIQIQIFSS